MEGSLLDSGSDAASTGSDSTGDCVELSDGSRAADGAVSVGAGPGSGVFVRDAADANSSSSEIRGIVNPCSKIRNNIQIDFRQTSATG